MAANNTMQKIVTLIRQPLGASVTLHLILLLFLSGTFTFLRKDFDEEPYIMAVELLPIADKASSTIDAPIAKKLPDPPKEVMPQDKPPPPPKSVEKTETKPVEKPKPDKPKEKPVEKKAEIPAKKPEKPKDKPKEDKPTEITNDAEFNSVLKNLIGEDSQMTPDTTARDTARQAPVLTAPAPLGSQMSMSEMDALKAQLARCWNVLPGARDADDLAVDVKVQVSPDRTVTGAEIVDKGRYNSDSFFRAAADSAVRALRAPECTPLELPEDKYDQWKSITIRFDPKEMF